ncbi:hypothetical protein BDR06DRAFT_968108 [Suillus hirtellus]|nr:hypothetical protein BDR06DRAFT_968108 [Suillus hirtellus]
MQDARMSGRFRNMRTRSEGMPRTLRERSSFKSRYTVHKDKRKIQPGGSFAPHSIVVSTTLSRICNRSYQKGKVITPMACLNVTTQKFALGGWVTNWISDVKPARKLKSISCTPSISTQVPIWKPVTETLDTLIGSFADNINNDTLECDATIAQGKGKFKVALMFEDNSDFDKPKEPSVEYESDDDFATSFSEQEQYSQEPKAPFIQVDNHRTFKQKASEEDISDDEGSAVSNWSIDLDGPTFEDPIMDFNDAPQPKSVVVKQKILYTMSSTSASVAASVTDSKPHTQKKLEIDLSVPPACDTPAIKCQPNMDTTPEQMKSRNAYCNIDLPATMSSKLPWFMVGWYIPLLHSIFLNDRDPDKPSPLTTYHSPFILQLLGTVHLNAINEYMEVPELNTHMFVTCGMLHVITISAVAIKCALIMFVKNNLKAKQAKVTTSFNKSILSKPAGYIETTIQMAHTSTALNDATETPQSSLDDKESKDDKYTMLLCKKQKFRD